MPSSSRVFRAVVPSVVLIVVLVAVAFPQSQAEEALRRGLALIQDGRAEEALSAFEEALEADPQLGAAHYYAGMALGQLQRLDEALSHFQTAAELDPGSAQPHVMACRTAYSLQDYDEAWNQCIFASQAGFDTSDAFAGLEQVSSRPDDFEERMARPRVFVADIDVSRLSAVGATPDTTATGSTAIAAGMADFVQIRRQLGQSLARSSRFAVTQGREQATYVLVVEIDELAETTNAPSGLLKLIDPRTEESVASRRVTWSGTSESALRGEADRLVGFLETQIEGR